MKSHYIFLFSFFIFLIGCQPVQKQKIATAESMISDPLPSWIEGQAKQSIMGFVKAVTSDTSSDFIVPADRIAVFDNDGTLWSEQPYYFQLQFALDRVKELAPQHPEWKDNPVLQAAISDDISKVFSFGEKGLLEIVALSHSGISTDDFSKAVVNWINTAKHPKTGKLFKEMVYQPMIEVLEYLRKNGFKTYIVSGGGIDFMRPWTQEVYGIPPEQVVGSSVKVAFEIHDGKPILVKMPDLNFIDDKKGKPVGIHQYIGKRPVLAVGNSDGDYEMLQWVTASTDKRGFGMIIHHTDSVREWAYDRQSPIGRLDKGLDDAEKNNWILVDMLNDWKTIYPENNPKDAQ